MTHRSAVPLRLLACAILGLVSADPTRAAAQTECEAKRRSCISECHARFFSIDPRRDACVAACMAEEARCARGKAERQGELRTLRTCLPGARILGHGIADPDAPGPICAAALEKSLGGD